MSNITNTNNFALRLSIFLLFIFLFSCNAQSDQSLRDAIQQSRQIPRTKEYINFFAETSKCISSSISSLCDAPIEGTQTALPCLNAWLECSKTTAFYNRTRGHYEEDLSLQSAYNFSSTNPLVWGTDPVELITNTNNFIFLVYSAKYILKEKLELSSKTTDFWNQMSRQYLECVPLVVGSATIAQCGTTVSSCYEQQKNCLFRMQSFYMSFYKDLPLDQLLDTQHYAAIPQQIPECDATFSCNSTDQTNFLLNQWDIFAVNMIAYLIKDMQDLNGRNTTLGWVIIGILGVFLVILLLIILIFQIINYRKNGELYMQDDNANDYPYSRKYD